jgi:hypothetical protein
MSTQSRHPLAGAALAVLANLAGPAAPGSAAPRADPPREINSQAKEMSPRISQCLIRREPALIDRWLRTLPGSTAESRLFRSAEPRFPPCFGQPYGVNGAVWLPKYDKAGMRAALVRARLQARRGDLPASPPPGTPSTWYGLPPGPPETPADGAALVAAELAACLAGKHWREVAAIVESVDPVAENSFAWGWRESKAERDREAAAVDLQLSKVVPSIPGCVPAGAKLRMNRLTLRRLLEEAAFQMMNSVGRTAVEDTAFKPR